MTEKIEVWSLLLMCDCRREWWRDKRREGKGQSTTVMMEKYYTASFSGVKEQLAAAAGGRDLRVKYTIKYQNKVLCYTQFLVKWNTFLVLTLKKEHILCVWLFKCLSGRLSVINDFVFSIFQCRATVGTWTTQVISTLCTFDRKAQHQHVTLFKTIIDITSAGCSNKFFF